MAGEPFATAAAATSASMPSSDPARNRSRPARRATPSSGAWSTAAARSRMPRTRFTSASRAPSPVVDSTRIGVGTSMRPSCSTTQRNHSLARCDPPIRAVNPPLSSTQRGRMGRRGRRRFWLIDAERSGERRELPRRGPRRSVHHAWHRARQGARAARVAQPAPSPPQPESWRHRAARQDAEPGPWSPYRCWRSRAPSRLSYFISYSSATTGQADDRLHRPHPPDRIAHNITWREPVDFQDRVFAG